MPLTVLDRAKRAFDKKQYSRVISLLEPSILQYRDSFSFYLYLGLACLHTGDTGGATSYFQRARQIRMRDPELLAAQAAMFLRRGETNQAVEYYLEALDYAPRHALSRRALHFIRKKGDRETFRAMTETGKISVFYPKPRRSSRHPAVVIVPVVLIASIIGFFFFQQMLSSAKSESRADLGSIVLEDHDLNKPVETGGSYRYILTEKQVIRAFEDSQGYFQSYRDNMAQIEINRILNSNAAVSIRQKARLLMEYLSEPGFDSLRDSIDYARAIKDVYLYQDCWVRWKGMATNVRTEKDGFSFDFLVGYDTRTTLEGIVTIKFDKVLPLDTGRPLEVLGRISVDDNKIVLRGGSLYQQVQP